jgi:hypothetical protein
MAFNIKAYGEADVLCPHCEEETTVVDFEIACMSRKVDESARGGDGCSTCICDHCGGKFVLQARARLETIGVEEDRKSVV